MKKEYEWAVDILSKLDIPYVGLIGNHDVIGNGDQVFNKLFGEENFSFIVRDVKFVCLNTNAIEYDYSHPVPDFGFLKKSCKTVPGITAARSLPCMHVPEANSSIIM